MPLWNEPFAKSNFRYAWLQNIIWECEPFLTLNVSDVGDIHHPGSACLSQLPLKYVTSPASLSLPKHPTLPLSNHRSLPVLKDDAFVLQGRCHVGPPFIALYRLFYLSGRHSPVLFQVIRALLQITLLPVWVSDPSQGSPLNLILIITSVINKRGLGRDYCTRPVPLFPTVDRVPLPTLSCHPGLSLYLHTHLCLFKDLVTL